MGHRQVNEEFYNLQSRNLLGIGLHYVNEEDEIKTINVDIITNYTNNAFCVVQLFRFLREQIFFQDIEKKNYNVWYLKS